MAGIMKRTLFTLAALAAASVAQADDILATMPNDAGGQIMLTTMQGTCTKDSKVVMATSELGEASHGCWKLVGDQVVMTLEGKLFVHPIVYFTVRPPQAEHKGGKPL